MPLPVQNSAPLLPTGRFSINASSRIYTSAFLPVQLVFPRVNSVINIRRRLYNDNRGHGYVHVYTGCRVANGEISGSASYVSKHRRISREITLTKQAEK